MFENANLNKGLRYHDVYKFSAIPQQGYATGGYDSLSGMSSPASIYLARYDIDRRSIFCGNLPSGTTQRQVYDIFKEFGSIEEITIRETPSKYERKFTSVVRSLTC